MNLESIEADRVEAVLLNSGAHAVTLSDAGDTPVLEPAPGETPLWSNTRITALFDGDTDFSTVTRDLKASLGLDELPHSHVEVLADRAWEREWLKDFGPMRFGERLWIVPGNQEMAIKDAVVVRLDPGLAFGTGTHPTTALCLEWLESVDVRDKTVLDFGCGSGILGVAACKLGASCVEGVDIDLQAVTASRQNAARNQVEDRFLAAQSISDETRTFDIVVANILAGTLVEYAGLVCSVVKAGGALALSGILSQQIDDVRDAYEKWFTFEPPAIKDDWARLSGTRR